ncbi:MAG: response regulator, partial [Nitrospirota bacterium]|nr:response regulator [Nitrospirota bacterium]
GISREHVAKIFREFYQVDSSHSRKYEGTGLGLALTKRFAELMGGEVAVESTVGAGSRFTITLPIKAQSIPPIPLPAQQPYHPRPELVTLDRHAQPDAPLILVVEDDAKASELLSIHLKQAGYGVVTASNGESAVRLAKELQPFAITLDIMLPKQDGWQVIQELKADDSTANIPVLVTSMLDDQNLAFSLGATDYFVKPVDKGRLLQRLGTISLSFNTTQGPATVLVVDDEPATLELLRATLEPVGYKVLTASGGADGIELARKHMPNIILLDLMMPEVSGFDVISALKESLKTRNIPIIIFTAKDLSREEIEELNADIENIYLKGDFEKSSLLEEIYRLEKIDPDRARMVDRLTGLPNYRYLKNRLMEESSRSDRYDRSFSLVMLDIDNFRQYNEANGSIIGDAAIKKVADLVKKTIRRCDIPTRYVDDKYFVVLPETGKSSAMVAAEKIRTAVEQFPFPYQEKLPGSSLTLSISVVHYSDDTDNLDQLVAFAQSAMGEAKKNGGNTVVFYKG